MNERPSGQPPPVTDDDRPTAARVLRRLLSLVLPDWPLLACGLLALATGGAAGLLYPWLIAGVIDFAVGRTGGQPKHAIVPLLLGATAVVTVSTGVRYLCFGLLGDRLLMRLRGALYARLLQQEIAFFDQRATGDLLSRLTTDITLIQNAWSGGLIRVLQQAAIAIGGAVMLLRTSPSLAALLLLILPGLSLGAALLGARLRRLGRALQDGHARAAAMAQETLSGIRTVRSFRVEEHERGRYVEQQSSILRLAASRTKMGALFLSSIVLSCYGAAAIIFFRGTALVRQGSLSIGQLTSFLIYSLLVAFAIGGLAEFWADALRAAGAAERVIALLDRTPSIPLRGGLRPTGSAGRIELRGVSFHYATRASRPALSDVNLIVGAGQSVALVGPSGAGKSTLAALLLRFYDPQSGSILFDDHALLELDPSWLRARIGMVSQEPLLFSTSILENIRYGRPDATSAEVSAAARTANLTELLAAMPDGLHTMVGERGVQLSAGQRQRIAIARAVLMDPCVLILDEATSSLDGESEFLVREALRRVMKGRTTIIIAHRLSTMLAADRVVVLDQGHIAQEGLHHELAIQVGLYQRLVSRQMNPHPVPQSGSFDGSGTAFDRS